MVAFDAYAVLARGFPKSRSRDKDYHELFGRHVSAVCRLREQTLTLPTNRQDPLVMDDYEFPKVFWVRLDFGSMASPIEILGRGHLTAVDRRRQHNARPVRVCIECSTQFTALQETLLPG